MTIETDLEGIAEQERRLRFESFDAAAAWRLGTLLREQAAERQAPVAIDIELGGMCVFLAALDGATPDNLGWIRRKRNVALRFRRPTYAIGLALARDGATLGSKFALPEADYAAHGGSFPIVTQGAGCIGAVTVSGLPQRDDHAMVVAALAAILRLAPDGLQLSERE